jgi:hypothetical protein
MKQKRRKLSMKVKDGLGPACPTCALPMQRWKHDPKWKPPARLYISRRALAHNDAAGKRRASTCGRPDIAAHPTNLSAEMRAAAAARAIFGPGIRAISRHGN